MVPISRRFRRGKWRDFVRGIFAFRMGSPLLHVRRCLVLPAVLLAIHLSGNTLARAEDVNIALTQANELGLLEFCKSKGFVDDATVELKARIVDDLAGAMDEKAAQAARKKGEQGIHSVMGIEQSIAELSDDHIRALCQLRADLDRMIETAVSTRAVP